MTTNNPVDGDDDDDEDPDSSDGAAVRGVPPAIGHRGTLQVRKGDTVRRHRHGTTDPPYFLWRCGQRRRHGLQINVYGDVSSHDVVDGRRRRGRLEPCTLADSRVRWNPVAIPRACRPPD